MFARIRRGMSFANVCSFLALVIALGTGTAYAANTVFSEDIVNGEVKTVDIAASAVTAGKIAGDAVSSAKVANGSLSAADLGTDSVGSDEVLNDSIQGADIADHTIQGSDMQSGTIGTNQISTNGVGASEIADGAVSGTDIASGTITGADVASNSLTTADIAGADVNGGHISVPEGYVPNGRCRTLDSNIGGAKAGEAVVYSVQAPLQSGVFLYGASVPSDGHVTFLVCNLSGATQTALSDFPVRVITFG